MREHLLRPSLTDKPASVGLYPIEWILLPAFFLGPFAVICYSMINSYRLRRGIDSIAYLLACAGAAGVLYAGIISPQPDAVQWLKEHTGGRNVLHTLMRLYAMLLCGVFYLMHRREQRSAALLADRPSPWIACIVCSLLAVGLTFGIVNGIDALLSRVETV